MQIFLLTNNPPVSNVNENHFEKDGTPPSGAFWSVSFGTVLEGVGRNN